MLPANAESSPFVVRYSRGTLFTVWHFLLPAFLLALLIGQIPFQAICFTPRSWQARTPATPCAAYVTLDPTFAARGLQAMRMAWQVDRSRTPGALEIELSGLDGDIPLPTPEFAAPGVTYPVAWRTSAVAMLPVSTPSLVWPTVAPVPHVALPQSGGVRAENGGALADVAFSFACAETNLTGRGDAQFYVETDATGAVTLCLLASKRTAGTDALLHALMFGRANGAARGFITVLWDVSSVNGEKKNE